MVDYVKVSESHLYEAEAHPEHQAWAKHILDKEAVEEVKTGRDIPDIKPRCIVQMKVGSTNSKYQEKLHIVFSIGTIPEKAHESQLDDARRDCVGQFLSFTLPGIIGAALKRA
ncbi:hypothetical protein KSP39_PZI003933 [Platanthera zijinensis]|uniref:Uncharacterized protein n=1 Tax=Platanthera zijinensis TaxID=2320716 RepID=A0AAP0GD54_9ASPA